MSVLSARLRYLNATSKPAAPSTSAARRIVAKASRGPVLSPARVAVLVLVGVPVVVAVLIACGAA